MAKKNISLKDTMQLKKKAPVKKTDMDVEKTEKKVSKIHSSQGKTKRVTIDIPLELHAKMKIKTYNEGITLKKYILDLAKKDLGVEEEQ